MNKECYEIRIKSHLGPRTANAFAEFAIRYDPNGETILTGQVVDQAALHGILMKIRDLNLVLVAVRSIPTEVNT